MRHARHALGPTGVEHGDACDVGTLLAHGCDTAEHHVIDIKRDKLPSAEVVNGWTGPQFASALRHIPGHPGFNANIRQLLHVSFKLAAKAGSRYLDLLKSNEAIVAKLQAFAGKRGHSMLELAFRSLSWLWAIHFFAGADQPGRVEHGQDHDQAGGGGGAQRLIPRERRLPGRLFMARRMA